MQEERVNERDAKSPRVAPYTMPNGDFNDAREGPVATSKHISHAQEGPGTSSAPLPASQPSQSGQVSVSSWVNNSV